jgi:hypothetical protein
MYHQLTPSSQLDITMVTEWVTDVQELFESGSEGDPASEDDTPSEHYLPSQDVHYPSTSEHQTPQKRKIGF